MKILLVLFTLFAFTASAEEIAGTWKASLETPNGNFETTFVFKVDGAKLTGTVSGPGGEQAIADGKVDGSTVAFAINANFNGNEFKLKYDGKVTGNELKLVMTFPTPDGERKFEMTAKKAS